MNIRFNKTLVIFLFMLYFFSMNDYLPGKSSGDTLNFLSSADNSAIELQSLFFETEDPLSSDAIIRDHLMDLFPLISAEEINNIASSKTIIEKTGKSPDSLSELSLKPVYKVTFKVPENFLSDTSKILWELNIPEFQSRLYQLFEGKQIYLDVWTNVVGTVKTKTYTGFFQAYRIRNWPFYKDPDPKKAHLAPTKPGPGNPLGLFVVHYDENSLRYFHGTDKPEALSNKMRNLSHGCVRNDNNNIEKMKQFIIKRVIKSKDLSSWLGSNKTLIHDFEESDKFPVKIIYKTFKFDKDDTGDYIMLFKDIYNYKNSVNIDSELNDPGLITLTNRENIIAEYNKKFGKEVGEDALEMMIDYLIANGKEYQEYYISDLKKKFMIN